MGGIIGALKRLVTWFEGMLMHFCGWLWGWLWYFITLLLQGLGIPETDIFEWQVIEDAAAWFAWADQYVPVVYGMQLLTVYWGFRVALIPIRFLLRHIPGVGG